MVKEHPPRPPPPAPTLCVLENGLLQRAILPHTTYLRLMGAPLFTPDKGQAGTRPIPILCLINNELNCFVPTDESEQNIC